MTGLHLWFLLAAILNASVAAPLDGGDDDLNVTSIVPPQALSCNNFNPCLNGGSCTVAGTKRFACQCQSGYKGSRCQYIDFCSSNPCQNGTCISQIDGFVCNCNTGYFGKTCNITDSCQETTCLNGGTCVNTMGIAKCQCLGPYAGRRCETFCVANRNCWGNGLACVVSSSGHVRCDCSSSIRSGEHQCLMQEEVVNECSTLSNPCNGGSCTDRFVGFLCSCPSGRTGSRCENENPCSPSPCKNGGVCSAVGATYRCACTASYAGRNCEYHSEPCSIQCTATSFEVSCQVDNLPEKIRSATLWTRLPDDQQTCTCKFAEPEKRYNHYGQLDRHGYYDIYGSYVGTAPSPTPCTIPYDSCGTKMQVVDRAAIYNNFVRFHQNPMILDLPEEPDSMISRQRGEFELKLECQVPLHVRGGGNRMSVNDLTSQEQYQFALNSTLQNVDLTLQYYSVNTADNNSLHSLTEFTMGSRIYAMVSANQKHAQNSDTANSSLSLSNCYATPSSGDGLVRYYLLENGCPRDETFRYEPDLLQQQTTSSSMKANLRSLFSFKTFLFKSGENNIYIHCDAELCLNDDDCIECLDHVTSQRPKRHVTVDKSGKSKKMMSGRATQLRIIDKASVKHQGTF